MNANSMTATRAEHLTSECLRQENIDVLADEALAFVASAARRGLQVAGLVDILGNEEVWHRVLKEVRGRGFRIYIGADGNGKPLNLVAWGYGVLPHEVT